MFCVLICVLKGDSPWSWAWLALAIYYQFVSAWQRREDEA